MRTSAKVPAPPKVDCNGERGSHSLVCLCTFQDSTYVFDAILVQEIKRIVSTAKDRRIAFLKDKEKGAGFSRGVSVAPFILTDV